MLPLLFIPATSALFRPSCSAWTVVAKHLTTSGLPVSRLSLCCYPVFSTSDHATSCLKPLNCSLVPVVSGRSWFKNHFNREGVVPSYREGPSCGVAPTPAVHQPSLALLALELSFILQYLPPALHLPQSLLCTSLHISTFALDVFLFFCML